MGYIDFNIYHSCSSWSSFIFIKQVGKQAGCRAANVNQPK